MHIPKIILYLAATIGVCGLFASCKHAVVDGQPSETEKEYQKPKTGTPEEVVLHTDVLDLTLADYDRCLDVHRLKGHILTRRVLANPRFQRDEVQLCLQNAYLKHYNAEKGANVLPGEREKAIRDAFERHGVQSEEKLAEKLGLTQDSLNSAIDEILVPVVAQRIMAEQMPPEDAERAFMRDQRKYTVEIADFDNTPSEADIDDYVKNRKDALNAYIAAHPEVVMTPPKADFVRLAYSTGQTHDVEGTQDSGTIEDVGFGGDNYDEDNAEIMKARHAAELLRQMAVREGVEKAIEFCQQDAPNGCRVLNDTKNRYTVERSDATAWAFTIPVGKAREAAYRNGQFIVSVLMDIQAPEARDISSPEGMRIAAAKTIEQSEPAMHILHALKPALEVENPDFKAVTEANGGRFKLYEGQTYFDLVGRREIEVADLLKAIAGVTQEQKSLFSNPIIHKGHMYIFRVNSIEDPTPDDYRNKRDIWLAQKSADPTRGLAVEWLNKNMPSMMSLNIKPIQKKYGTLQPNGTIL